MSGLRTKNFLEDIFVVVLLAMMGMKGNMKSNTVVVGIGLLFLLFATVASITLWAEVSLPVKIGMFAFGFSSGTSVGTLIARRAK